MDVCAKTYFLAIIRTPRDNVANGYLQVIMRPIPSNSSISDTVSGVVWDAARVRQESQSRFLMLGKLGVGPGDYVVLGYGGSPAFFSDLFAIWQSGAVAVCVTPDLTAFERENINSFLQPRLIVSSPDTLMDSGVDNYSEATVPRDDAPALVLLTSGTTDVPKAVVLSHGAVRARIALNLQHISEETLRRTLCVLPTHFGHGLIGNCLTALYAGGDLILMPGRGLAQAGNLSKAIDEHEISFLSSTPSFWNMALRGAPPTGRSLRQISIGSAPVSAALAQAISDWAGIDDVRVMYGITECANWISGYSLSEHAPQDGYVGRPWGGDVAVRDEGGAVVRSGAGEILVKTPAIMSGYVGRNDLSESVMIDGWYRTGDSGRIDEQGGIFLTGRIKEEINRGGVKVSPTELDTLLEKHENVLAACAFSVPDDTAGERVGVAIRLHDGVSMGSSELRDWCATKIRQECVPDHWSFVTDLPTTDRGKIDRRRVREQYLEENE